MISALRVFFHPFVLALVAASFASCAAAQNRDIQDLTSFPRTTLVIHSKPQPQQFNVWVADTAARQQQGLMFVRDLPAGEGMVFINEKPRVAAMWMKNTYISLDMLFVTPDGRIAKIAENTVPHSLKTVGADVPVIAVVELKGGEAGRRGLKVGDLVDWKTKTKG
jgi:uncharacterized membrane protein (UPF0127 family)